MYCFPTLNTPNIPTGYICYEESILDCFNILNNIFSMKARSLLHAFYISSCTMLKQTFAYFLVMAACALTDFVSVKIKQPLRLLCGRITGRRQLQPAAPPLHFPSLSGKQAVVERSNTNTALLKYSFYIAKSNIKKTP